MPGSYRDRDHDPRSHHRSRSPQRRSYSPKRYRDRSRSPFSSRRDMLREPGFSGAPPSYGQSSRNAGYDGYRLHLSNLRTDVSKAHLEDIFGKYGRLNEVYVARQTPCFAFVNFQDKRDAARAKSESEGLVIGGNQIYVNFAKERQKVSGQFISDKNRRYSPPPNGRYGRSPDRRTQYGGRRSRSPANGSRNYRRSRSPRRRSYSPKRYRNRSHSPLSRRDAMRDPGFTNVPPSYGQPSKIPVYDGHRLHLSNLNMDVSKSHLEDVFGAYGELYEIYVARQTPCFAFVNFKEKRDAEKAQAKCDGMNIGGNRIIVNFAKSRQKIGGQFITPKDSEKRHRGFERSRSRSRSDSSKRERYRSGSRSSNRTSPC